ncbi:MAG: L,D-transpeptidase family protein [Alphaproteobacteria bacterium]
MIFQAWPEERLTGAGLDVRCTLGRGGIVPAKLKREGDGASPAGVWVLRRVLYRPDRGPAPKTALPASPIAPDDGWCDAPGDPRYNQLVKHPYPASAEHLCREDGLYDLIVVLGHNDDPPVPGAGSAIFLHLASPVFAPTEGCVAIERDALEALLAKARPGDALEIVPPTSAPSARMK